jgi:hypothetical protein
MVKRLEAVARCIDKPYTIRAELEHFDQLFQDLNPPLSKRLLRELPLADAPTTIEGANR